MYHKCYRDGQGKIEIITTNDATDTTNHSRSNEHHILHTEKLFDDLLFPDTSLNKDIIHAALSQDPGKCIILVGKKGLYRINVEDGATVEVIENSCISSV